MMVNPPWFDEGTVALQDAFSQSGGGVEVE